MLASNIGTIGNVLDDADQDSVNPLMSSAPKATADVGHEPFAYDIVYIPMIVDSHGMRVECGARPA